MCPLKCVKRVDFIVKHSYHSLVWERQRGRERRKGGENGRNEGEGGENVFWNSQSYLFGEIAWPRKAIEEQLEEKNCLLSFLEGRDVGICATEACSLRGVLGGRGWLDATNTIVLIKENDSWYWMVVILWFGGKQQHRIKQRSKKCRFQTLRFHRPIIFQKLRGLNRIIKNTIVSYQPHFHKRKKPFNINLEGHDGG